MSAQRLILSAISGCSGALLSGYAALQIFRWLRTGEMLEVSSTAPVPYISYAIDPTWFTLTFGFYVMLAALGLCLIILALPERKSKNDNASGTGEPIAPSACSRAGSLAEKHWEKIGNSDAKLE